MRLLVALLGFVCTDGMAQIAELIIDKAGNLRPAVLTDAKIDVALAGTSALVKYNLSFESLAAGSPEGTFYFKVPRHAYVHDFVIQVNGVEQKSLLVKNQLVRGPYETRVRRGIDPALVKWSGGDYLKMRVFPINSGKPTRIRLALGIPALAVKRQLQLYVPSDLGQVGKFSFNFKGEIIRGAGIGAKGLKGLQWSRHAPDQKYAVSSPFYKIDFVPPPKILITQDVPEDVQQVTRIGQRRHFETFFFPKLPRVARERPHHTLVFWDYSLSERRYHGLRKKILRRYDKVRRPKKMDVYGFHNYVFPIARSKIRKKRINVDDLLVRCDELKYDGGTRIDQLVKHLQKQLSVLGKKPTDIIIFSNVTDSFRLFALEKYAVKFLPKGVNLFVVSPTDRSDTAVLRHFEQHFGGVLVDQDDVAIGERFQFQGMPVAVFQKPNDVEDLLVEKKNILPGHALVIRGRKTSDKKGNFVLSLGGRQQVIAIDAGQSYLSTMSVRQLWARSKVDQLMLDAGARVSLIEKISLDYQVRSPYTGWTVLETCRDYRAFKVVPPLGCSDTQINSQVANGAFDEENADYEVVDSAFAEEARSTELMEFSEDQFLAFDVVGEQRDGKRERQQAAAIRGYEGHEEILLADEGGNPVSFPNHEPTEEYGFEATLRSAAKRGYRELYEAYHANRRAYENVPYFYIFTASRMVQLKQAGPAELVLSNIVEQRPGKMRWLTNFAFLATDWDREFGMLEIHRQLTQMHPDDPRVFRDYGIALAKSGRTSEALKVLRSVKKSTWVKRLAGFSSLVEGDIYRIAGKKDELMQAEIQSAASKIEVTATWDSEGSDVDLHILEPSKDHIYYGMRKSRNSSGELVMDATMGYGPERYVNTAPQQGKYLVALRYFSANPDAIADGTLARVDVIIEENDKVRQFARNVFLKEGSESRHVMEFTYADKDAPQPPPDFKRTMALARREIRKGKFEQAKKLLSDIGESRPDLELALVHFELARVALKEGDYPVSLQENERALALNSNLISARYNIVCALALGGNLDEAFLNLEHLKNAVANQHTDKWSRYYNLIQEDLDLAAVRQDPRFAQFLEAYRLAH